MKHLLQLSRPIIHQPVRLLVCSTMVQYGLILGRPISHFPRSLQLVSEDASESSSAKQANEQVEERMAGFLALGIIVLADS